LPVLWGDRFVGRIALETKTNEGKLIVKQFWREAKVRDSRALRRTLNRTLERFARFHGCPDLDGRFTE
ncbi:MAG: DNA glycosylase AlkZ-like family protein, partial [Holdemania filiformis]